MLTSVQVPGVSVSLTFHDEPGDTDVEINASLSVVQLTAAHALKTLPATDVARPDDYSKRQASVPS